MDKATLRAFISDILLVFGLAILLLSTVLPFLTFTLSPIFHPTMPFLVLFSQADLSTFSVTYDANTRYSHSEFFGAYWLHSWLTTHYSLPVSYVVAAFALQVATLLVGFATFFTETSTSRDFDLKPNRYSSANLGSKSCHHRRPVSR